MDDILKKYDLDAILEVVQDRLDDYADNVERYYEEPADYQGVEIYNYRRGYGDDLRKAVQLVKELTSRKVEIVNEEPS
jgi:hypothetical protein